MIGGGTGGWDVPVGGMGAVSGGLAAAAAGHGAETPPGPRFTPSIRTVRCATGSTVRSIGQARSWCWRRDTDVLAEFGRMIRSRGKPGAQVKVNLLLNRLPRLRDETVTPEQAFGGTFHINENYSQLEAAYSRPPTASFPIHCPARSTAIR